jgi:hypothetical protein
MGCIFLVYLCKLGRDVLWCYAYIASLVYGMHDFILISGAACLERRSTMAQKYNGRLYFFSRHR